jgi:kumamolisin
MRASSPPRPHGFVPLVRSVSLALHAARILGAVAPATGLTVEIRLRLQHEGELRRLLHDLYTPGSSVYHHFLTVRQFAARFAPPESAERGVERWLGGNGLHLQTRFDNGLLLTMHGSARAIQRTFRTPLATYALHGRAVIANTRPIEIPAALAPVVAGVGGLSPSVQQQPAGLALRPARTPRNDGQAVPAPADGYSPRDVAQLYDLTPLSTRGLDGAGQTVALIEFSGYDPADLTVYNDAFGISAGPVDPVPIGDGNETGGHLGGGDQAEAELDIDMVHAVAPAAHILVYESPNSEDGALAMWNRVVSDDRASVISTSWGAPESVIPADAADGFDAMNGIFEEAAAQGQSLLAASGDRGAYDAAGDKDATDAQQRALSVDFPASDPWVTGVGGTTLEQSPSGGYGGEIAWSDRTRTPQVGSGGGLSTVFPRPDYQVGPGVTASGSTAGMRQVPDVAANADARTGYAIYSLGSAENSTPQWRVFGGTSASAPLWAGITALANQDRGHPLGFLNPGLYSLGAERSSAYHDVTSGDNLYYSAGPGWDFATGWGSPDGNLVLPALAGYTAPTPPTPSPTAIPTATPTATPTSTPAPTLTLTPTATGTAVPTAVPLAFKLRLAHALVKRNAVQTLTVQSTAGVGVDLEIRYPGGRMLTASGRTGVRGRWHHTWAVSSRRAGTVRLTLTLNAPGGKQVSHLSFAVI